MKRIYALGVGAAWVGVIGWLTLRSAPSQAATVALSPWYCVACGSEGVADLLLNVVLFLPLGIAAFFAGWRLTAAAAIAFAISVAIELTQGIALVGRDASLGDVITNTIGGSAGWIIPP